MKVCGYCNNEYDDKEIKCPVCGSTILKHEKNTVSARAEYERIEQELKNKRKKRSMILGIGIGVIAIIVLTSIISVVRFINNPQKAIDKEAKQIYEEAVSYLSQGEFDSAIAMFDEIDTSWSNYDKVSDKRAEAVKGQLTGALAEYETAGDYEAVITYINQNVDDVNLDTEIRAIYDNSVVKYKSVVMAEADEYVSNGDYSAATSILTTAIRVIGTDTELERKMSEVGKTGVLAQVKEYKNNDNYVEAIQFVNDNMDIVGYDSEILIELSSCEDAYRNIVIAEAEEVYQNSGYEAAVEIIDNALQTLNDDEILEEKHSYYLDMAPKALIDLQSFHNDYGGKKLVGVSLNDKLGNNYLNCIEYFGGTDFGAIPDAFSRRDTYVLSGEYSKLRGTIFVPDTRSEYWDNQISDSRKSQGSFSLRIYGDEKLLYQSPLMISTQYPVAIEIDISGIDQISFGWATFGDVSSEIALADVYLYK